MFKKLLTDLKLMNDGHLGIWVAMNLENDIYHNNVIKIYTIIADILHNKYVVFIFNHV